MTKESDSLQNGLYEASEKLPFGKPPKLSPETPFNPFFNDTIPLTNPLMLLKTILMIPLCIFRLILMIVCAILCYVTSSLALVGAVDLLDRPFAPWRRLLLWPPRLFARGILLACGYNYIHIKGKPADREVAPVLVSNHVSFIDPFFIFYYHLPIIVTAKENLAIPLAGTVIMSVQAIIVDRSNDQSRKETAGNIKRRAMCNDWNHVALFPEATTTNGRSLVTFKMGAFSTGLPIQPMVVRYPHTAIDPCWVVEGPSLIVLLLRLMTQFHNRMEVEYLDVMEPTYAEVKNPALFADRCRMRMAQALNVTVTEHAYGDVALGIAAAKLKPSLPMSVTNVEFGKMERLFRLNVKEGRAWLKKFTTMNPSSSGTVCLEDFVDTLGLPDTENTRNVFAVLDVAEQGEVEFREFVAGLAFLSRHEKFPKCVAAAFQVADRDRDGRVSPQDAHTSFKQLFPEIADSQIRKLFQAMDLNKDGSVSREEFEEFLQLNPEYAAAAAAANPELLR
eukprot:TRINITY_DN6986_c0_g1_i2.p1 TRINITY_DN6986_c0_g1~~TRINITY_DN6986_c0_g1_i2.p1  ORF type:complete len:505 (-),score=94.31 TRINITY_DN6986_c0_g1_i2:775-2289(-)